MNDYRMLGLGDKTYLFQPTATGHAESAWTSSGLQSSGSPFFAVGHLGRDPAARVRRRRGHRRDVVSLPPGNLRREPVLRTARLLVTPADAALFSRRRWLRPLSS